MGSLQKVQVVARKAFESLYFDRVTITETEMKFDPKTKTKKPTPVVVHKNKSCKLDFKSESVPDKEGINYSLTTQYLLYVSPDIFIREGSLVEVTMENGQYFKFGISGSVKHYPTHNEYPLIEQKKVL